MKRLLPWLKANLISVVAVVVAILAAPVMLFFSMGWSASNLESVQQRVGADMQSLDSLDVTYRIDPYISGMQPLEFRGSPNEATTQAVAGLLQEVLAGSKSVREQAIEFNSRDKSPLIGSATEPLFPEPPNESTKLRLLQQFPDRFVKAHGELLKQNRAGAPPTMEEMRITLEQHEKQERARRSGGRDAALSSEDEIAVREALSAKRLEAYRQAAAKVTFYATPAVFRGLAQIEQHKGDPTLETAWNWQFMYWVHQEIIRALAIANTDQIGAWLPAWKAPVKRIESIRVFGPGERPGAGSGASTDSQDAAGGSSGESEGAPTGGASETAEVPRNFTLSFTGRAASPVAPNPLYDLRFVELVIQAAADELPRIIAAFPKTNFMSVVGLRVQEQDALPALASGFDFGAERVIVRAELTIETVWLRAWTKKWMPTSVRQALGVSDDVLPAPAGEEQSGTTEPGTEQNQ